MILIGNTDQKNINLGKLGNIMFQDQLLSNLQGIMFAVGCLNRKRNFKEKL